MKNRLMVLLSVTLCSPFVYSKSVENNTLWDVYNNTLKSAKYIDLTHAFEPLNKQYGEALAKRLLKRLLLVRRCQII